MWLFQVLLVRVVHRQVVSSGTCCACLDCCAGVTNMWPLCNKVIQARRVVPGRGEEKGGTEGPRVQGQSLRTQCHILLHDITQDTVQGMVDRRMMFVDIM